MLIHALQRCLRSGVVAYGLCAAIVAAVLSPILFRPGFPAYQQDWSWSARSAWVLAGAIGHISAWNPFGLGSPNALASANPLNFIIALPALVVSGFDAGKIVLASTFLIATFGVLSLSRLSNAPYALGVIAAVAYATSPVAMNELGAGHSGFLFAYALTPWLVAASADCARAAAPHRVATVGLFAALCTIQPQYVVFAPCCALMGGLIGAPRLSWKPAIVAVVGTAVAMLPTAIALSASRAYLDQLFLPSQAGWESLLSTSWPDVLWQTHYIVPYYEQSIGGHDFAIRALAVLSIAAMAIAMRGVVRIATLALTLVALFFLLGTYPPVGFVWQYLYAHEVWAEAFRETTTAGGMLALAYTLAILASYRYTPLAAIIAAVGIIASAPFLAGAVSTIAPNVIPPPFAAPISRSDISRTAALPVTPPISYHGSRGGVDIFGLGTPTEPGIAEYPALFPIPLLDATTCGCEAWFRDLLIRFGVAHIAARKGFVSLDLIRQRARPIGSDTVKSSNVGSAGLIAFATSSEPQPLSYKITISPGSVGLSGALGVLPGTRGAAAIAQFVAPHTLVDNPKEGWVALDRWRSLDSALGATAGGIATTTRKRLALRLPNGGWSILHSGADIRVTGSATVVLPASTLPRWDALPSNAMQLSGAGGRVVIYRVARGSAIVPRGPFASITPTRVRRSIPWQIKVDAPFDPRATYMLVFRDRFSRYWAISGADVLWHGVADGFGNAFVIRGASASLTITYAAESAFLVASVVVWIIEISAVVCWLLGALHRRLEI